MIRTRPTQPPRSGPGSTGCSTISRPIRGLAEAIDPAALPAGTREGTNDWKRTGYGGPCPPIGRHRYFFKLFALDTVLSDLKNPTKAQLEAAMQGHILERTELLGLYQKSRS